MLRIAQKSIKAIPEGFANLSNLVYLNLFFNQLEGLVPKTGLLAHINASSMMENQNLCGAKFLSPCRETKHSLSKKSIAIIASLGSLAMLLLPVFVIPILNREPNSAIQYSSTLTLERFTTKELENATRFFNPDSIISVNSLITVYKVKMEDGQVVAVKNNNSLQILTRSWREKPRP
ncbi:hypothetical protein VNO78_12367 [Psophocarpus tetragonolobus]|uniref:Uncharacterized protein n=1 Tax=Psophocarpus tetragonolobus TaxID=3891 RepID=A0AAN9SQM9_PSOTE